MKLFLYILLLGAISFFRFTYRARSRDKTSYIIVGIIIMVILFFIIRQY